MCVCFVYAWYIEADSHCCVLPWHCSLFPWQVGFHKNFPESFYGDSALRLPDGVGVSEAESNPLNGHYVGYWDPVSVDSLLYNPEHTGDRLGRLDS